MSHKGSLSIKNKIPLELKPHFSGFYFYQVLKKIFSYNIYFLNLEEKYYNIKK